MDRTGKRLLGLTFNGQPIWEPQSNASSLVFAATSGGKTTCVAVPTIISLLSDNRPKQHVKSHQLAWMEDLRKKGMIDG